MAETFGAALKRYHAAGYRGGDAMRAVWHDVKIGRVDRPRTARQHVQGAAAANPRRRNPGAVAWVPAITARAAGRLVRSDPAVRRLPRVGYCVRLSDGRELCHDARGYYLIDPRRNPLTRKETGQALVAARDLARLAKRIPSATAPERADPVARAAHRGWWYGQADAMAQVVRKWGTLRRRPAAYAMRARRISYGPYGRRMRGNPLGDELVVLGALAAANPLEPGTRALVRECAWHPQYFGARHFDLLVPLPRGMSREAFIAEAVRQFAVTHGVCAQCKPRLAAEIPRRANPWSTYAGGTTAHHGYSYDHRSAAGEYHIWPPSTRTGSYHLLWANTKRQPAPHSGLWHDLGRFRSPQAAKSAAKAHALERGVRLNPSIYAHRSAARWLAGLPRGTRLTKMNPRRRSRRPFRNAVAGLEAFPLSDRRGWEQAIRDVGGLKVSRQDRADFAEVPGYLKGYRKGLAPDELAQMVADERGLAARDVERALLAAFHAPRRHRPAELEDYERLEREAIQSEAAPRARRRGGESRPRVGVGADTFHLRPRSPFKGSIHHVNVPRFAVGQRVRIADPYRVAARFWSAPHGGLVGAGGLILRRELLDRPASIAQVGPGGSGLPRGVRRVLISWGVDDENRDLGMWLDSDQLVRANPSDRYVDLLRQGFMRRALGGARRPRPAAPIVRCERCQDWHRRGQHTRPNPAGRAHLTRFYDAITEIRGVKGRRFGFPHGTRFRHPFTTRPVARGVDRSGLAYLKRGQVVLGGRRPIYAQLGAA